MLSADTILHSVKVVSGLNTSHCQGCQFTQYFTLSKLSVHSIFHSVKAVCSLNTSLCQCFKWTKYFTLSRLSVNSKSTYNPDRVKYCVRRQLWQSEVLRPPTTLTERSIESLTTLTEWRIASADNFDREKYWVTDNLDRVKYFVHWQHIVWTYYNCSIIPEVGLAVRFTYQNFILFFNQVCSKSPIKHDISNSGIIKDMSFQSIYVSSGYPS
jgi:hypothetical protein